jgi:hypothetical protein
MANKSRSFLKNQNRDFNNILDSVELASRETSSPTGTSTVLANTDSGKIIFMDASSANTITLPAIATVETGWNVKVILTATGAAGIINCAAGEDLLVGYVNAVDADGSTQTVTADADGDRITFVNACVAGAYVDICSDGSKFYVYGFGTHATASDKLTLTKET